jgi:hypothetical protein
MPQTTAKDFFLQLGTMIVLYSGVIALLNLLFTVINHAFPRVATTYYYYSASSISFPVATLIVAFPLFLWLSWVLKKEYTTDPSRRELGVRKWLLYITLFVSAAGLAGDLVTVIYYFLDGQDLTSSFLLKALSVLVVVGGVFLYYLQDLRNTLTDSRRTLWRIVAAVLVLGSIVLGFSVIGSPATQRKIRQDSQRVMDLQNLQNQIPFYYQQKGSLPTSLEVLNDSLRGFQAPVDPVTGAAYEYRVEQDLSFSLCATFERPSPTPNSNRSHAEPAYYGGIKGDSSWQHGVGRQCFTRTIDPAFYPLTKGPIID